MSNDTRTPEPLTLFIDELNDVTGGRQRAGSATTLALGEEGGSSTRALREEGGSATTLALGEEGGTGSSARVTTLALGEEG